MIHEKYSVSEKKGGHHNMNNNNITYIYQCEDSTDGILTAVYDAWASRRGHSHIKLQILREADTMELFSEYIPVQTDAEKAEKVRRSVLRKISTEAWEMVFRASLSNQDEKADLIYRFLVGGFYYGAPVTKMMAEPVVMRMTELARSVSNEAHEWKQFIRFDEQAGRILFARFRPKNHVIFSVAAHFADRLSGENFLILDTGRSIAAVHPAGQNWYLASLSEADADAAFSSQPDEYRDLWKTFFDSIAIKERTNPKLQQNMMPLRYREYAVEFGERFR